MSTLSSPKWTIIQDITLVDNSKISPIQQAILNEDMDWFASMVLNVINHLLETGRTVYPIGYQAEPTGSVNQFLKMPDFLNMGFDIILSKNEITGGSPLDDGKFWLPKILILVKERLETGCQYQKYIQYSNDVPQVPISFAILLLKHNQVPTPPPLPLQTNQ